MFDIAVLAAMVEKTGKNNYRNIPITNLSLQLRKVCKNQDIESVARMLDMCDLDTINSRQVLSKKVEVM